MAFLRLSCSSVAANISFESVKSSEKDNVLCLEGDEADIFGALARIANEDLAVVDGFVDSSGGMLRPHKVNAALREAKVARWRKIFGEESAKKAYSFESCPIDRMGYMPFPQNTKKTTQEHQRKDAVLICKCVEFRKEKKDICAVCETASLQRALKESRGE